MEVIKNVMNANKCAREKLQSLLAKCRKFIQRLPETRREDLAATYPDAIQQLRALQDKLQTDECVILVAGKKNMKLFCFN